MPYFGFTCPQSETQAQMDYKCWTSIIGVPDILALNVGACANIDKGLCPRRPPLDNILFGNKGGKIPVYKVDTSSGRQLTGYSFSSHIMKNTCPATSKRHLLPKVAKNGMPFHLPPPPLAFSLMGLT